MTDRLEGHALDRRVVLAGAAAGGLALASGQAVMAQAPAGQKIVKSMTFMIRKPGQTHAEFMKYWLEVHAPMALKIPGMRGMVCIEILKGTNRRTDIAGPSEQIEVDGVAESWKLESNSPSNPDAPPEARAWYEDGPKFVGKIAGWRVDEHVFLKPKRGGKGLLSLLQRKAGVTHEQFAKHWLGVHGPMAAEVPEVAGLILNEPNRVAKRDDIPPLVGLGEIDGIAESWHKDTTYPGIKSPEGKRWYADGADLIGNARGFYTQEHVIIDPF